MPAVPGHPFADADDDLNPPPSPPSGGAVEDAGPDVPGPSAPDAPAAPPLDVPAIRPETERAATWDLLSKKKARTDVAFVSTQDDDGKPLRLKISFRAISGPEYDKLQDAHPAKPAHQAKGFTYNPETFPAAVLEATVTDPKLSFAQWQELSKDPDWSGGEFGALFFTAQRVCQGGLDIPFTGLG